MKTAFWLFFILGFFLKSQWRNILASTDLCFHPAKEDFFQRQHFSTTKTQFSQRGHVKQAEMSLLFVPGAQF